jgi:hypothetical protein
MNQARKLTVIKNDLEERLTIIRPELNLEQWLLWQPANARDKEGKPVLQAKVLEKEIDLPNGQRVIARVTADFSSFGALTTEDQKTLYALVKTWEEKGEDFFKPTYFSVTQLLQTLKRKRGGNSVPALIKSLRRLRSNHVHLEHSFLDAESGERVTTIEDPITILSELKVVSRGKNGKPVRDEGYFKFHPLILKNLAANFRKPVLIDVVLSLKNDVAQLIYSYVDRQLTFNTKHKIRSENLFQEIGLERKAYKYASQRKQTLDRTLSELTGKRLSSGGTIKRAALEPTKDKKDLNVVFEKSTRLQAPPSAKKEKRSEDGPSQKPGPAAPPDPLRADDDRAGAEDALIARRVERLVEAGFVENAAAHLASKYPDECDQQLDALPSRNFSKVNDRVAWLRCAIEQGYALPASPEQGSAAKHEKAQKAAECPFCNDSGTPGMRRIINEKYPRGAWKECSHDPETESNFMSAD